MASGWKAEAPSRSVFQIWVAKICSYCFIVFDIAWGYLWMLGDNTWGCLPTFWKHSHLAHLTSSKLGRHTDGCEPLDQDHSLHRSPAKCNQCDSWPFYWSVISAGKSHHKKSEHLFFLETEPINKSTADIARSTINLIALFSGLSLHCACTDHCLATQQFSLNHRVFW